MSVCVRLNFFLIINRINNIIINIINIINNNNNKRDNTGWTNYSEDLGGSNKYLSK